jgi:cyanophycin synthetase
VQALGPRRTILAFTLPGDRREDDLRATTEATLGFADAVVVYDTHERRGRAPGEVPELLKSYLPDGVLAGQAPDQRAAITAAWQLVQPGDRLVLIADIVEDGLEQLQFLEASVNNDTTCGTSRKLAEREVSM